MLEALPEDVEREDAETLRGRFANWLVLAYHVAARGEILRAWDALGHAHRHLLWLARLEAGATDHWLTPSRQAEKELPAYVTGPLAHRGSVQEALATTWRLGRTYWPNGDDPLVREIDGRLLDVDDPDGRQRRGR